MYREMIDGRMIEFFFMRDSGLRLEHKKMDVDLELDGMENAMEKEKKSPLCASIVLIRI